MNTCKNRPQNGFTLVELLVVIAIIGVLVAVLLFGLNAAKEASRRISCAVKLKQIGTAIQTYDRAQDRLPTAWTDNGASAFVLLLSFVEEKDLWERFDNRLAMWQNPNKEIAATSLDQFRCPSMVPPEDPSSDGWSSYAVSTGSAYGHFVNQADPEYHNGAIVQPGEGPVSLRRLARLDGASKTFLAGEIDFGLADFPGGGSGYWASGYPFSSTATTAGVFNSNGLVTGFWELNTFRSDHQGGVNMLLGDNSVRFVVDETQPDILKWLAKRNDGRRVENF